MATTLLFCVFTVASYGYHISESQFLTPHAADLYCQLRCNSTLATIENEKQMTEVIEVISKNQIIKENMYDVWIGNNDGKDIVLQPSNNYQQTTIYQQHEAVALCYLCDTIINKYIVNTYSKTNYDHASDICFDKYGTTLASIHSTRDETEALQLSSLTESDCWIGLSAVYDAENNQTIYEWDDHTSIDQIDSFPWAKGCPEYEDCIALSKDYNFSWIDTECQNENYFLCFKPSQLCPDRTDWGFNQDSVYYWQYDNCEINLYFTGPSNNGFHMYNKQFYNSNGILTIEHMFTRKYTDTRWGDSTILLYNAIDRAMCSVYDIAVGFSWGKVFVEVTLWPGHITYANKQISKAEDDIYLLSVTVINGSTFNVSVNDVQYISVFTNVSEHTRTDGLSGYIVIKAYQAEILSHYLYISGEPVYMDNTFDCAKIQMRRYPTSIPTVSPSYIDYSSNSTMLYGVVTKITFQDVFSNNITEVIISILDKLLSPLINNTLISGDCVGLTDYNATVVLDKNWTIIKATVTLCDQTAQTIVKRSIINTNVKNKLIDNVNKQTTLQISSNNTQLQVDTIDIYGYSQTSENIASTTTSVYDVTIIMNKSDHALSLWRDIFICATVLIICLVLIFMITFFRKKIIDACTKDYNQVNAIDEEGVLNQNDEQIHVNLVDVEIAETRYMDEAR
eukprot:290827_1